MIESLKRNAGGWVFSCAHEAGCLRLGSRGRVPEAANVSSLPKLGTGAWVCEPGCTRLGVCARYWSWVSSVQIPELTTPAVYLKLGA